MKQLYKTFLSLAILSAASWQCMDAKQLSFSKAMKNLPEKFSINNTRAQLKADHVATFEGLNVAYVINRPGDNGFVLVSADDLLPQVLGYADSGNFDSTNIPPALKQWIEEYGRQLSYATNHAGTLPTETSEARASISPLCKAKWGQSKPFNDECPKTNNVNDPTGCTATAVAQVLKTHNWPTKGKGINTYTYTANGISRQSQFNFSDTEFDWTNMLDSYSNSYPQTQAKAVATLMAGVGNACRMMYAKDASGAYLQDAAYGLVHLLRYDKGVSFVARDYYTTHEWDSMMYNELKEGRAIVYTGLNDSAAHAFVVDGYADGYYHLNWGWNGMSDGYFLLTALDPTSQGIGGSAAGYNFTQSAIIYVKPESENSEYNIILTHKGAFQTEKNDYASNSNVDFKHNGTYFEAYTLVNKEINLGVLMTPENGGETVFVEGPNFSAKTSYGNMGWLQYFESYSMPASVFPKSGTYFITPAFKSDGVVEGIRCSTGYSNTLKMTCSASGVTFEQVPVKRTLSVSDFKASTGVYQGKQCSFTATISNSGEEFHDFVHIGLFNSKGELKGTLDRVHANIPDGESCELTFSGVLKVNNVGTPAGEYDAYLYTEDRTKIGASPLKVTIEKVSTDKLSFTSSVIVKDANGNGTADSPYLIGNNFSFDLTINVKSGFFDDMVNYYGYFASDPNGGRYPTISNNLKTFLVGAGNSQTITYNINTAEVPLNELFYIWAYGMHSDWSASTAFIGNAIYLKRTSSGLESIATDDSCLAPNPATETTTLSSASAINDVAIYSMGGVRMTASIVLRETHKITFDVSQLPAGYYVVAAQMSDGPKTFKLIRR